jgi:hypothetical protein
MRRIVTAGISALLWTTACAMAQTGADYLDLTRVQVRGEKSKDFEDAIKKMAEVNRKYKGDRWVALSTVYGEFGGYTFSSTRENMAAVESGMGAFERALKEGLGPLGDKLMRDLYAFSSSGHNELRHRRWDLSVNAPSNADDLAKMVAKTRWIRALTVNIKPGRAMDYIQAWKPFKDELQKVTPPVPILVSEATTGSSAVFVGVYYQSWAEMDAGAPGVQRAVESKAYQALAKATQDSVAASGWEILRVRPDLSCPPDAVVQADSAFWKPKPAPAAASKAKTDTPEKK